MNAAASRAAVVRLALAMCVVVPAMTAGLSSPAMAQMDSREGIALQNQILELRRDLQAVQQGGGGGPRGGYVAPPMARGGGGGSEISAQLLDRVQSLEEEVRRLRGQLDEQANASRRAQDELAKQIADMGFRVQNAGSGGSAGAGAGPSPTALNPPPGAASGATQGAGGAVRRPPELAMQEGNAALARRDYPMAEAAAREVLGSGGRGPRAGDAQFLLAQALTGKRDFQGAAIAYDDAYNRARTGPRAPDALVGVAGALFALNDRPAACASLDKLRAEFPSMRADVRENAAGLRGRAGCR